MCTCPDGTVRSLRLNLTRYEFLMRVGDGALPGNFSRECYEDILAFKSALLSAVNQAHAESRDDDPNSRADIPSVENWTHRETRSTKLWR